LRRDVGVVLVAAGQGRRMGSAIPKQYREIAGVPMLLRALRPFVAHPEVAHTVIALPPEDAAAPPPWLAELLSGSLSIVAGGAERGDSVAHALAALPGACELVLVHDAARPLVDRSVIDAVIAAARGGEGAVPAIPVGDTLKEATQVPVPGRPEEIHVQRTVPRDRLYRAQTPQGFPRAILEEAHAQARHADLPATDDAAMVERLGVPVLLVPGSPRNFKVTTEDDLRLAELLVQADR
jgi:2-C-methyl-D-erythritol 4-phosphate cytidylyltransferase